MIYINVIVEGPTEETFIREVLAPYWGEKGIFAQARCVETGRKKGRKYTGGGRSYEKIKRDVSRWLSQGNDAWCTTMFDLYGPVDFPGRAELPTGLSPYEKVIRLESAFGNDIAHRRFIPYIQLHEFEALLFAGIDKMSLFYLGQGQAISNLIKLAECFDSPELINEGFDTAPSKRIIKEIPEYCDDKVLVGPTVAKEIGIQQIRQKCRHFHDWMCQIEKLTEVAGI